jgi:2-octaprenyl-6-methoxyphenol hydroxylase
LIQASARTYTILDLERKRVGDKDAGEIIVAGTGAAGLLAALALAGAGFRTTLVGPEPRGDDRRTTALMSPALVFLDGLGLLDPVREAAAPLRAMRIVDATTRLLRSPPVTFRATEIGRDSFGLNIPNAVLFGAAKAAIAKSPKIQWRKSTVERWDPEAHHIGASLADGTTVTASLAIAADGRNSPARAAAGIETTARDYPQSALVLDFAHSRDHGFISTEFHTETGPFTQVPMPGRRSSLVWVERPETAAELMALDDSSLSLKVEARMQSMLGRVTVEPGRQLYPLSTLMPDRFARNRVALVGEAAHVFPPIGAQGLNLGIRDIEDVVRVASEHPADPGAAEALRLYDARRRPDVMARSGAVNMLNRSLISDMLPAQMARSAGLGLLGSFAPLRGLFMREGMQPGSGFARMATALREQVRRQ